MRDVSILDYGVGNFASVSRMIEKLGGSSRVISSSDEIDRASTIVLPGVGSFDYGMKMLKQRGLDHSLKAFVSNESNLLVGICLGMQLLCESSEEGATPGLGLVEARVTKIVPPKNRVLPVPHMGWNVVTPQQEGGFLPVFPETLRFYFAHSYRVQPKEEGIIVGLTDYGGQFCSAFVDNNIHGYQFHPEKSHKFGLGLFANLLKA